MSSWGALLLGAGVVVALTAFADLALGFSLRRPQWSVFRIGLGLGVTLATVAAGGSLASVHTEPAPEQLGVAAVVDGSDGLPERGFDVGMLVATHVTVTGCDDDVEVRLSVTPTAEFWIDNRTRLRDGGHLDIGIPDDDVVVHEVVRGQDETVPLPGFKDAASTRLPLDYTERTEEGLQVVSVDVPRWGRTPDAVMVRFTADWTERRSRLGGCYVTLPALTGLPTVLTASRVLGEAAKTVESLPGAGGSLFVVSSRDPGWHALYNPDYEVTRGVTTLSIGDYSVDASLSLPAATTSIGGTPAWTCHSAIVGTVDFLDNLKPGDQAPDFVLSPNGAAAAFAGDQAEGITAQSSCGSLVALTDPGYGTRRDLLLILVGALFSFGIELLLSGVRRREAASPS